jgi:hypothetical protein
MEKIPHIRMIHVMRLVVVFLVHSGIQGVLRESLGRRRRHRERFPKFPEDPFFLFFSPNDESREGTARGLIRQLSVKSVQSAPFAFLFSAAAVVAEKVSVDQPRWFKSGSWYP